MQNNSSASLFNNVKLFNLVKHYGLFVFTLAVLSGCSRPAPFAAMPPPTIPVQTLSVSDDTTFQEYPASIEGSTNIEIRPQVSGQLVKVYYDEGSFVAAGQPLFKINELPYRAALSNAEATLHAAVAAEGNAKLDVEKLTQLVQNKVVSGYQLKTAEAAYDVATANTEQARASVSTAQINLNYTIIKAPSGGFISRLGKKQGSLVAPGDAEPLTILSDVQNVHVYFSLGERDFVTFKEKYAGKTLNEKISHLPPVELLLADESRYDEPGRIDIIDGQFDKTTGAITVRASFPNPNGLLRSGNTGKIRLSLLNKNVLIIPQSATMELQDRVFVYTLADSNKVKRQSISVIGKSGTNFLVREGVKAGDKIVVSGWEHLQDGEVIQPEKYTESLTAN